jgi:hypothetical protein
VEEKDSNQLLSFDERAPDPCSSLVVIGRHASPVRVGSVGRRVSEKHIDVSLPLPDLHADGGVRWCGESASVVIGRQVFDEDVERHVLGKHMSVSPVPPSAHAVGTGTRRDGSADVVSDGLKGVKEKDSSHLLSFRERAPDPLTLQAPVGGVPESGRSNCGTPCVSLRCPMCSYAPFSSPQCPGPEFEELPSCGT